jgi:DNA-binding MarR family transcriptional regulator
MKISKNFSFFISLAKLSAVLTRKFDGSLMGLGFSEFIILYHLAGEKGESMRRVDLAEKLGLTASGVTRLLAPMEKVGYIKRDTNPFDARESLVKLATGGKRKMQEVLERAELLCESLLKNAGSGKLKELQETLEKINV